MRLKKVLCGALFCAASVFGKERAITQDDVEIDVLNDRVTFNGESVDLDELKRRAKASYSIYLSSTESNAVEGAAPRHGSMEFLIEVLSAIEAAELDPERLYMDFASGPEGPRGTYHAVELTAAPFLVADGVRRGEHWLRYPELINRVFSVSVHEASRGHMNLSLLLEKLRLFGDGAKIAGLEFSPESDQVEVSADDERGRRSRHDARATRGGSPGFSALEELALRFARV